MLKYAIIGLIVLVCLSDTASATPSTDEVPCQRVCSEMWGPSWTACKGVKECEAYVDMKARECLRDCQKGK